MRQLFDSTVVFRATTHRLAGGLQTVATRGRTSLGSPKPSVRPFSDKKPDNPTPDNIPPEDGLTRYPTLNSPQVGDALTDMHRLQNLLAGP